MPARPDRSIPLPRQFFHALRRVRPGHAERRSPGRAGIVQDVKGTAAIPAATAFFAYHQKPTIVFRAPGGDREATHESHRR